MNGCDKILYITFPLLYFIERVDKQSSEDNIYHYLTEAAKFAASYRMELGDPDFDSTADVVRLYVQLLPQSK